MKRFHISATGHSLNYLPQYIAARFGYFRDVGLDVTIEVPDPWTKVLTHLNDGSAQAALGGIWVPAMLHQVKDYRAFCQLSARCPLVLVSRHENKVFDWHQLDGKLVVVSGTGGSSSYVFLAGLIGRAGVDLNRIRFVRDLDFDMLLDLFSGGLGDYMLVDAPTAWRLVAAGKGHIALDLSAAGGPVPWSVYYTTSEALAEDPVKFSQFGAAIQRAVTWLRANSIADLIEIVSELWPAYEPSQVVDWLVGFKKCGMWNESIEIDADALSVWQDMLAGAGLLEHPLKYDAIVRTLNLPADIGQKTRECVD